MELFHGSNEEITEIRSVGVFGGLFASSSKCAAASHAPYLHKIISPRHLTNYALNYEIAEAYDIALELSDNDERIANAIMSPGCEELDDCPAEDIAEQGWEFQRLRGLLAAKLGYTSIEMLDEHGTTTLCLPGCTIQQLK